MSQRTSWRSTALANLSSSRFSETIRIRSDSSALAAAICATRALRASRRVSLDSRSWMRRRAAEAAASAVWARREERRRWRVVRALWARRMTRLAFSFLQGW